MSNIRNEQFSVFNGKTVLKVDASSVNVITFHFTDGTYVELDCDDQVEGIGIINVSSECK